MLAKGNSNDQEKYTGLCLVQGTYKDEEVAFLACSYPDEDGSFQVVPMAIMLCENMIPYCLGPDGQETEAPSTGKEIKK